MADEEFRTFVELKYAQLLRTAYLLAGSPELAEDVLQSALLAVMVRWRRVEQPEAYLRRVMVNQLVSRWRRRQVVEVLTAVLPERAAHSDQPELRDELWQALRRLPPRMRAVLVLRYWEDLSEAATADALGCSVGAVKSQASRGLVRLRELIAPDAHPALSTTKSGS
ncbi:MAG: RNA polymerase subunit sigma-24 [Actinobacteria bacterium 13_2_20CM_2_71_6]|nr:MAG: RNA polymerase subunit sigma-24 [Actinobacteria bacterium 13_2_20CM_2_71_6]